MGYTDKIFEMMVDWYIRNGHVVTGIELTKQKAMRAIEQNREAKGFLGKMKKKLKLK